MLRPSSGKRDGDKQKERKRKRKKEGEKWLEERPRRADNSARYRGGGVGGSFRNSALDCFAPALCPLPGSLHVTRVYPFFSVNCRLELDLSSV